MKPRQRRIPNRPHLLSSLLASLLTTVVICHDGAPLAAQEPEAVAEGRTWASFQLSELTAERKESGRAYLRFHRVPSLSTGLYELAKGEKDLQRPHDRDEIYHVIAGKARFEVDGEELEVGAGSILYVKTGVEHRFHTIEEDLTVLVVFAAAADTH